MKYSYKNIGEWLEKEICFSYMDIFTFYKNSGILSTIKIHNLIKEILENNQIKRYGKYYVYTNVLSTM